MNGIALSTAITVAVIIVCAFLVVSHPVAAGIFAVVPVKMIAVLAIGAAGDAELQQIARGTLIGSVGSLAFAAAAWLMLANGASVAGALVCSLFVWLVVIVALL